MGRRVALGDSWAGEERGFRLNFAGAKTNRRLFRAAASRPVTDGHESSRTPQSGIIEKSGGYFARNPGKISESLCNHVLRTAGTTGRFIKGPCGKAGAEQGRGKRSE